MNLSQDSAYPKTIEDPCENFSDSSGTNTLYISIFLKNVTLYDLKNIEIIKQLPFSLIKIVSKDSSIGSLEIEKNRIIWKIDQFPKQKSEILHFQIQLASKEIGFGEIKAQFIVKDKEQQQTTLKSFEGRVKLGNSLMII